LLKLIFSPFKFMKFCADLENDLIFVFFYLAQILKTNITILKLNLK